VAQAVGETRVLWWVTSVGQNEDGVCGDAHLQSQLLEIFNEVLSQLRAPPWAMEQAVRWAGVAAHQPAELGQLQAGPGPAAWSQPTSPPLSTALTKALDKVVLVLLSHERQYLLPLQGLGFFQADIATFIPNNRLAWTFAV